MKHLRVVRGRNPTALKKLVRKEFSCMPTRPVAGEALNLNLVQTNMAAGWVLHISAPYPLVAGGHSTLRSVFGEYVRGVLTPSVLGAKVFRGKDSKGCERKSLFHCPTHVAAETTNSPPCLRRPLAFRRRARFSLIRTLPVALLPSQANCAQTTALNPV